MNRTNHVIFAVLLIVCLIDGIQQIRMWNAIEDLKHRCEGTHDEPK
jgi:hypothetical protein